MLLLRKFFGTALALALCCQLSLPALASTVGTISGTVTDATGGKPLANVAVAAVSASGTYRATTDARGFYSMTGVSSDTYTVSFQLTGYEPVSEAGVTVPADQIALVNESMRSTLRTIANVRSRAGGSAFQPHQTADTYTVTSQQIQTIQGNALNISEKNLLRALPGVSYSTGDYPTIRGGRANAVDYQLEGMSMTDPYLNTNISNFQFPGFAIQSVQLSPGEEDASFGNSGVGTVNVVARQGTDPPTFDAIAGVGGPGFYHALNLGWGTATQNGRWSNYASYTVQNTGPRYGGQYASSAREVGATGFVQLTEGREFTDNLLYHWGQNNKYDLQFFVDNSWHKAAGGYGQDYLNECYDTCDPAWTPNGGVFSFTNLTLQQYQNLLSLYPGQTQANQSFGQNGGRPPYQEFYNGNGTKLQFDWHVDPKTYLFVSGYESIGTTISDNAQNSIWREQGGWTSNQTIGIVKQLGERHLLKAGASAYRLTPLNEGNFNTDNMFDVVFDPAFELPDFVNPSDPNCPYVGAGNCGYLYKFFKNPTQLTLPAGAAAAVIKTPGYSGYITDAWQPNAKLKVDAGARVDHLHYDLPAPGVLPDCTTRYVPLAWQTPDPNGMINGKPVGPGNCPQALFQPLNRDRTDPTVVQPRVAVSYELGANDVMRLSYGRSVRFIHGEEMDYAAPQDYASDYAGIPAYLNPAWAVVGNPFFGKAGLYNAGTPYATSDPNNFYAKNNIPTDCGFNGYYVPCTSYQEQLYWAIENGDFAFPISPLRPVTYNNWDFSYEHDFGKGWSVKVTPWARRTYDLDVIEQIPSLTLGGQTIVDASGTVHFLATKFATNEGLEKANGVELYLTKLSPIGLSGQISMTYNNVRTNILPGNGDEFHGFISPDVAAFQQLYRVGYVSPLTSSLALEYTTPSKWRFQTSVFYDIGYPYGGGLFVPADVDGHPTIVARTNAFGGGSGSTQYVDPSNPGSFTNPNIAATRGTNESATPAGSLSPKNLTASLNIEKDIGSGKLGLAVDNIFNELYTGPTLPQGIFGASGPFAYNTGGSLYGSAVTPGTNWGLNDRYQPVATGISGPLTGIDRGCLLSPQTCSTYGSLMNGTGAYVHRPNGEGRNWYLYYQFKL